MTRTSYVSVTDMFCGAGGSSIGVVRAGAELKLALNHWQQALDTHNENFPLAEHILGDIRTADPRRFPTTDVLIASPECTSHTLAKGRKRKNMHQQDLFGKSAFDPSEERSRATMWDVPRFAEHHRYNIVIVENVVDSCLYWPPFDAWLLAMHSLGYAHELVFLNSMFAHPTPQSRDRLYIVFWRIGNQKPDLVITPPAWCGTCVQDVASVQSWKNQARRRGKYGIRNQYVYRCPDCHAMVQPYYFCAATAIDWSIQGERIGDRARPLKPKTIERIKYGLAKFGRQPLAMRYDGEKMRPTTEPMPTQTTWDMYATVSPFVMGLDHGGLHSGRVVGMTDPVNTQTGQQDKALVAPFLMGMHGDYYTYRGMDEVAPCQVATGSTTAFVTPPFIAEMHGQSTVGAITDPLATVTAGGGHHGLLVPAGGTWNETAKPTTEPFPTQTTREQYGVVQGPPPFLLSFYGERHGTHAIDEPAPTIAGMANHALVGCLRENNVLSSVEQPVRTVIAGSNQHFLLVPYNGSGGHAHGVQEPTRTVTTHDREGLLQTAPDVEDCYFRMLQPHEIQAAMAFPKDYIVRGTARDKVRQLGNAVTPPVMQILFQRCVATLAG